jgi:serine/threonine protein phosphatase PrpC
MRFVLRESLSLPGDPGKANEDAFAQDDSAALVLDGATPLGEALMPGPSDAAWLSQFGCRRLMAHLKDGDAPKDALTHALQDAEKSFRALARRPVREKWETPCASMMMVTQAQARNVEFLWFGDCTALVLKDGDCEVIGDGFDKRGQEAQRARQIIQEKNLSPAPDLNRPEILSALRAARNRINSGRHWLFSPEPRAAAHVSRQRMRVSPGNFLLLASDGFMALATDYGAYNAAGLMAAARDNGLAALGQELRALETDDAMGEKFPRFKKSDDATALLLEVV